MLPNAEEQRKQLSSIAGQNAQPTPPPPQRMVPQPSGKRVTRPPPNNAPGRVVGGLARGVTDLASDAGSAVSKGYGNVVQGASNFMSDVSGGYGNTPSLPGTRSTSKPTAQPAAQQQGVEVQPSPARPTEVMQAPQINANQEGANMVMPGGEQKSYSPEQLRDLAGTNTYSHEQYMQALMSQPPGAQQQAPAGGQGARYITPQGGGMQGVESRLPERQAEYGTKDWFQQQSNRKYDTKDAAQQSAKDIAQMDNEADQEMVGNRQEQLQFGNQLAANKLGFEMDQARKPEASQPHYAATYDEMGNRSGEQYAGAFNPNTNQYLPAPGQQQANPFQNLKSGEYEGMVKLYQTAQNSPEAMQELRGYLKQRGITYDQLAAAQQQQ